MASPPRGLENVLLLLVPTGGLAKQNFRCKKFYIYYCAWPLRGTSPKYVYVMCIACPSMGGQASNLSDFLWVVPNGGLQKVK